MVVEGSNGEETTKVTVIVISSGETVRPVTVSLVTSEDTATGNVDIHAPSCRVVLCCFVFLSCCVILLSLSISLIVV